MAGRKEKAIQTTLYVGRVGGNRAFRAWFFSVLIMFVLTTVQTFAASTSWKGTTSTSWSTSSNWTNGVPTSSVDAILGDASFTGGNQPSVNATSTALSLTVGGSVATTLSISSRSLTVSGNITINSNGTISMSGSTLSLTGNWSNSGSLTTSGGTVTFRGTTQSVTGATTFRGLTINAGSTTTLNNAIGARTFTNSGTFDPSTYLVTISTASFTLSAASVTYVKASTFAGNYSRNPTSLSSTSIIDYASTSLAQTVAVLTYGKLRISGGTVKTLAGTITLVSSASTRGVIDIVNGTLDLSTFTADRGTTVAGGTISISALGTLKIGSTNTFPANYATHTVNTASTVEYYGTNQTVTNETYGNLILSTSGTKTMPATALAIAGNFTMSGSASATAGAAITITGDVTLSGTANFSGSTFANSVAGNWTNNATYTGSTGSMTFSGTSKTISGTGTNNFNDLIITGAGIIAAATTNIGVSGNFSTSGSGTFTHTCGTGTLTMSGTAKTISGTGIIFSNLTISGGSTTTAVSFTICGDFSATGSFAASAGTITMSGTSKSILGAGSKTFFALSVSGTITTAVSFIMLSDLSVAGSLTGTAGTASFMGTSNLSGTANLFNVTLNGTLLRMGANSVLGVAGALTLTAGTFDVTTNIPNTVNFNSSGAQNVNSTTYNNLTMSNGGNKTAAGAITVNGDLTIGSGPTFIAGAFTHSLYGNWSNSGTLTAGAGTIQLLGGTDVSITGATTFGILTINKSSSSNIVTINSNVTVATINMTTGEVHTGSNTLTISTTRNGSGYIYGSIKRTNAFSTGVAYAFEGTDNTITFASLSGVTSVTVTVATGTVAGFPFGGSINRAYTVAVPAGTYNATWRMHYLDAELNGNTESSMKMWGYVTGWADSSKTSNDATANYVEKTGITSLVGSWTLSDDKNNAVWNGSISSAWETAGNWTATQGSPSLPPGANDQVYFGTAAFTNQPTLTSSATVKSISFGSTQAVNLTLGGGATLTTSGAVDGTWSGNATHSIAVGAQTLNVGGDLSLGNGAVGNAIDLSLSTGTVTVTGNLTETGGSNITYSGAGNINIGGNFTYTSGTFSCGTGTVTYNGTLGQSAGSVTYYNLTVNKTGGTASLLASVNVTKDLTVTAGSFVPGFDVTITGNATVSAGATLDGTGVNLSVGGNWAKTGTFTAGNGIVIVNGTAAQSISATTFNTLTINKTAGTATLTGNVTIGSDLSVTAGTLDLSTFTSN